MAVYQNLYGHVTPVDTQGEHFPVGTAVTFNLFGQKETGVVSKLLIHSAVVKIDPTLSNKETMLQTNGCTVINYHKLTRFLHT